VKRDYRKMEINVGRMFAHCLLDFLAVAVLP
jgi:hypothetical protein